MAAAKKSHYAKQVARLAKATAKTKAAKLHQPLYEVFVIAAAAGDLVAARRVLDVMYTKTPVPKESFNAFATSAIDVFCAAAGFGDLTRGRPAGRGASEPPALAERVVVAARMIHQRVISSHYGETFPEDDSWKERAVNDPWRQIERWRRIQMSAAEATPESERDSLRRVAEYLADLGPQGRGAGYGSEVALCLHLALKYEEAAIVEKVIREHAHRFANESFLLQEMLCYPLIAAALVKGLLGDTIAIPAAELTSLIDDVLAAVDTALAFVPPFVVPKVQKRRVACSFSQFHIEPEEPTDAELEQVHFQKLDDSDKGMSLFPTMVAVGTPTETDYVDAKVSLEGDTSLDRVAQAVAFPLVVRGPIRLTSADGDRSEDPVIIKVGTYDVLARFYAKKAPKASAEAGLRVFDLALTFHPAGALGAPKTLLMLGLLVLLAACRTKPEPVTVVEPVPVGSVTPVASVAVPLPPPDAGKPAADPFVGIWHAGLAIPGGSAEDVHAIWSDGRWQWHASSHRGCEAGVVDRMGTWRRNGDSYVLEEKSRVVRGVVDATRYHTYRACNGYWNGKTCDKAQPKSTDADCTAVAGTKDEKTTASHPTLTTGPCVRGKTKTSSGLYNAETQELETTMERRCLSIDGQAFWSFGGEDDISSYLPPP